MSNILPEFYADIKHISKAIKANKLVVFVGAGVSMNAGVPSWYELIEEFKKELPENKKEIDYLKIAELYKLSRKPKEYLERVREILKFERTTYNDLHKAIFSLHPCHVVTTNYDDLLEQYAASNNLFYYPIVKDEDLPYATVENFIIKMHGDLTVGNIVLSEEEYLNYELNFPLTENYVKSLFSTKLILFVGFSFNDPNLKIITNKVKNILGKHFQPMYMLNADSKDHLQIKYYESRGVKIIDFNNESIIKIISNTKGESNNIENEKGKQLYKMLFYISSFDIVRNETSNLPFFEQIFALYQYNYNELNFVGKNEVARLITNNTTADYDNFHKPFSIVIKNPEIQPLLKTIKKIFLKNLTSRFIKEGLYKKLLDIAKQNLIFNIMYPSTEGDGKFNGYESIDLTGLWNNDKDSIDELYELNYKKVKNRIEYLQVIQKNEVSIAHLELPYLLYKLGKDYESYIIYDSIANKFWKQKKYVLFFISMVNIKNLRGNIYHYSDIDKEVKEKILNKIDNINLDTLLSRLPINNSKLEKILREILTYKFVLDTTKEVTILKEKILESKRINESPHGFSLNNHDIEIYSQIGNLWTFCNCNFIISEHFSENIQAYKNAAEAFLINYSVNLNNKKSVIDMYNYKPLNRFHLLLISIYLKPKELTDFYNRYNIPKLEVDESGNEFLKNVIHNGFEIIIDNSLHTHNLQVKNNIYQQFQNALILSANSELIKDDVVEVYTKISKLNKMDLRLIIDGLNFYTYKTLNLIDDVLLLESVLNNVFKGGLLPTYRQYETIIKNIIIRLHQIDDNFKINSDLILTELFSVKILTDTYETELPLMLLDSLPINKIEFLRNNVLSRLENKMDYHLLHLLIAYEIGIEPEIEKKFIQESITHFNARSINTSSSHDEWHLFSLYKMWKKYKDSENFDEIIKLSEKLPFLSFLINPQGFDFENDKFQIEWLRYLSDNGNNENIIKLIKLPKLKNYLKKNLKELEADKNLMELILEAL